MSLKDRQLRLGKPVFLLIFLKQNSNIREMKGLYDNFSRWAKPTEIIFNQEDFEMKKSNFVALILGTIGGIFFALGMCMALLPEWGMFNQGIVCGIAGLVILLITVMVWRKMEGKAPVKLNAKTIGSVIVGVLGSLILGVGMCLPMVFGKMVSGIVIGLVGILVLLMLIPLVKGIK